MLCAWFLANGHRAVCRDGGRLAEDVLYAAARGETPLTGWPRARLIAGMVRHHPPWRPPLEAWRSVASLARALPEARFLLCVPSPGPWVAWRTGLPARAGFVQADPNRDPQTSGQAALEAHLAEVRRVLAGDPRLIEIDLAASIPADLAIRLQGVVALTEAVPERWPDLASARSLPPAPIAAPIPVPPPAPPGWAADVARFCLQGLPVGTPTGAGSGTGSGTGAGLSAFACHWDGAGVTDAQGAPRQFARVPGPDGRAVMLARTGRHFKLLRAEGVMNDILCLDRADPVWIDMEDSRWFGSPQGAALDRPVLCHNRRTGARGAVLWPLPDQHAVGLPGFDPAAPPDDIAWEDKIDRVIWRGMISGSEMRAGVKPGPASHTWLRRLAEARTPAAREVAWQGLCRTNRMAFLQRHFDDPDFDLGIVMAHGFRDQARDPLIAPYCRPRLNEAQFRAYRYRLCLTGYDHGSNFVSGLDQNGVLLAEEDGWQVFYSGRFKPWRHYIPVARHLGDLPARLAWARANPAACRDISAAARAEAAHLRDPAARREVLRLILDGMARAR